MALLNYFQPATSMLPKPDGPLSRVIPASSIAAANKEVKKVLDLPTGPRAEEKKTTSTIKSGSHAARATGGVANIIAIRENFIRENFLPRNKPAIRYMPSLGDRGPGL